MKLLPQELDLLIAEHGNNAAYAEGTGDWAFAEFSRKREALLKKFKESESTKAPKAVKRRPSPDVPKPPKLQ